MAVDTYQLNIFFVVSYLYQVVGNKIILNPKFGGGKPRAHILMYLGINVRIDSQYGPGPLVTHFGCLDDMVQVKFGVNVYNNLTIDCDY